MLNRSAGRTGGSSARIVGSRGVSQVLATPLAQVVERLSCQLIQTAGSNIALEFAIPLGRELGKPFAKLRRRVHADRARVSTVSTACAKNADRSRLWALA